jgi:hypothetical protein
MSRIWPDLDLSVEGLPTKRATVVGLVIVASVLGAGVAILQDRPGGEPPERPAPTGETTRDESTEITPTTPGPAETTATVESEFDGNRSDDGNWWSFGETGGEGTPTRTTTDDGAQRPTTAHPRTPNANATGESNVSAS